MRNFCLRRFDIKKYVDNSTYSGQPNNDIMHRKMVIIIMRSLYIPLANSILSPHTHYDSLVSECFVSVGHKACMYVHTHSFLAPNMTVCQIWRSKCVLRLIVVAVRKAGNMIGSRE